MKVHKFKDANAVLHIPGVGRIHNGNITESIYAQVIAVSDKHADLFELVDEVIVTPKKATSKTSKQSTDESSNV